MEVGFRPVEKAEHKGCCGQIPPESGRNRILALDSGPQQTGRKTGMCHLIEDGQDDDHDHFDHDPSDHDHSDHDHTHHFDLSKTKDLFADPQRSLRGSELRIGKCRRMQGASYGYWVDVYVEIDNTLCTNNHEMCTTEIGTNTIKYG